MIDHRNLKPSSIALGQENGMMLPNWARRREHNAKGEIEETREV